MLPAGGGQVRTNQIAGLVIVPILKVELLGEDVQSPTMPIQIMLVFDLSFITLR